MAAIVELQDMTTRPTDAAEAPSGGGLKDEQQKLREGSPARGGLDGDKQLRKTGSYPGADSARIESDNAGLQRRATAVALRQESWPPDARRRTWDDLGCSLERPHISLCQVLKSMSFSCTAACKYLLVVNYFISCTSMSHCTLVAKLRCPGNSSYSTF